MKDIKDDNKILEIMSVDLIKLYNDEEEVISKYKFRNTRFEKTEEGLKFNIEKEFKLDNLEVYNIVKEKYSVNLFILIDNNINNLSFEFEKDLPIYYKKLVSFFSLPICYHQLAFDKIYKNDQNYLLTYLNKYSINYSQETSISENYEDYGIFYNFDLIFRTYDKVYLLIYFSLNILVNILNGILSRNSKDIEFILKNIMIVFLEEYISHIEFIKLLKNKISPVQISLCIYRVKSKDNVGDLIYINKYLYFINEINLKLSQKPVNNLKIKGYNIYGEQFIENWDYLIPDYHFEEKSEIYDLRIYRYYNEDQFYLEYKFNNYNLLYCCNNNSYKFNATIFELIFEEYFEFEADGFCFSTDKLHVKTTNYSAQFIL